VRNNLEGMKMAYFRKVREVERTAFQYATKKDFCRVFTDCVDGLYQLALLLTGTHETAEQSFLAGIEDCFKSNGIFKEWAHSWAKRSVIQNAIRLRQPQALNTDPLRASVGATTTTPARVSDVCPDLAYVFSLEVFERSVFVISVLEGYSDADCAVLLCSSIRDVRSARVRALQAVNMTRETSYENRPRSHTPDKMLASINDGI
jgi:DNA-directed RNA polymerase specialized sigma24 family protein